jgi:hypothetical protein
MREEEPTRIAGRSGGGWQEGGSAVLEVGEDRARSWAVELDSPNRHGRGTCDTGEIEASGYFEVGDLGSPSGAEQAAGWVDGAIDVTGGIGVGETLPDTVAENRYRSAALL